MKHIDGVAFYKPADYKEEADLNLWLAILTLLAVILFAQFIMPIQG